MRLIDSTVSRLEAELIAIRRDVHAHPELSRREHRTTALLVDRLRAAGLAPHRLPTGTGLYCDIGFGSGFGPDPRVSPEAEGPDLTARAGVVMLRADIDALPLSDDTDAPYASIVPGVAHACGHDVHTVALLGAGLALAAVAGRGRAAPSGPGVHRPATVRLVFQPAEETVPGGALDVIETGIMGPVTAAFALHCDPAIDVGAVGLRTGPITAAADMVDVVLSGPGGHTSRPHHTVDLVQALATIATGLPEALTRLVDPRAALSVVWGRIEAGTAANAIPAAGRLSGTVRTLSRESWDLAPKLVEQLAVQLAAPYGAQVTVDYRHGVPPVVNAAAMIDTFRRAVAATLGASAEVGVAQSLGGEDFGWYLDHTPGALARLGVRTPGGPTHDLHQGTFDVDERAIAVGARLLAVTALEQLSR
ncbi:MAG: amidohydrolase [Frankia sp.]